jgi:protein-disulfide isomerase
MASRAEQKAQARAARIEREQKEAESAARRRRLMMLGGVVVVAAVVLIVAIVASSSGGGGTNASNNPTSASAKAALSRVDSLLAGIPEVGDNGLGKSTAPVTVTEYGDLECSVCDEFALATGYQTAEGGPGSGYENQLISQYVRSGEVKLVYKSLETATSGSTSPISDVFQAQQAAAYAAGLQGKAWYYIELFYNEQGPEDSAYVTNAYLDNIAKQIPGLNYAEWAADRTKASLIAQVNSENSAGTAVDAGSASTPTIVVSGPKGQGAPIVGLPTSWSQLASEVKSAD